MSQHERWPRWVYGTGEEPDYRFSFANERTFLAWVRTSLALLAAAVAIDVVDLNIPDRARTILAALMIALGISSAALAWWRWASAERAIRRKLPLPSFGPSVVVAIGLVVVGVVLAVTSL